jgi:CheY-like chemotaxis protein
MPLILAIEPDKRQAAHLTSIARHRLHVEIVLADSAERALAVLGDRVPDLILTPALLPPQDETALADRLRDLADRAAHVQTLTVPLLAPPRAASPARGMLAALRRERPGSSTEGCDPAMFAEQITAYLERAAIERKNSDDARADQSAAARTSEPVAATIVADAIGRADATPAAPFFAASDDAAAAAPRPATASTYQDFDFEAAGPGPELEVVAPPDAPEPESVRMSDDSDLDEDDNSDEIDLAPFLDRRGADPNEPAGAAAIMAAVAAAERSSGPDPAAPASDVEWAPLRFRGQPAWPALEGAEVEQPGTGASAAHATEANSTSLKKKRSSKTPLQDEWGFFDPAQCGFAALLAKLEEITEKDDVKSA